MWVQIPAPAQTSCMALNQILVPEPQCEMERMTILLTSEDCGEDPSDNPSKMPGTRPSTEPEQGLTR